MLRFLFHFAAFPGIAPSTPIRAKPQVQDEGGPQ